jgi:hypothetical protein
MADAASDDLLAHIDTRGVEVLNAIDDRAWTKILAAGERDQDTLELVTDDDETCILSVPFTTNVKPTHVVIVGGGTNGTDVSACAMVKVFVNKPSLGFEECAKKTPAQTLDAREGASAGGVFELDKTAFDNVRTLTFYFESNVGDTERTSVRRLEIRGRTMDAADVNQLKKC